MSTNTITMLNRLGNLFTTSEAAEILNAHPNTIRKWADLGLLNCYRMGPRGHRRFLLDDLKTFLGAEEN